MREVLPLADAPDQAALKRAKAALAGHAMAGGRRLVLVDGVYVPELSDVAGLDADVGVQTLRDVLEDAGNAAACRSAQHQCHAPIAMVSLNAAMMTDGVAGRRSLTGRAGASRSRSCMSQRGVRGRTIPALS